MNKGVNDIMDLLFEDHRKVLPVYDIWYHLIPKDNQTFISNGIMSPYYMYYKRGLKKYTDGVTYKYRDRLCNGWGIYPDRDPRSLTTEEVLEGLKQFRGEYGDRYIYLFRYPPYKELGYNMSKILKHKILLEVDLSKVPDIVDIDYGYIGSNSDNGKIDPEYYVNVTRDEYFSNYDDNTKSLLFASINHIAVATKSGRIAPYAIKIVKE